MIEIHPSQITNHDPFGVQVNICFLRGPLGWLTEQEKPRIPSKFAKRAAWYNEFIFNVSNVEFPAPPLPLFPPLSQYYEDPVNSSRSLLGHNAP